MKEQILSLLQQVPYGHLAYNKYVFACLILLGTVIFAKLLLLFFRGYLRQLTKKTKTHVDDIIIERTEKPLFLLLLAYGLKLSAIDLELGVAVLNSIHSVMALTLTFLFQRIVDILLQTWSDTIAKKTKTRIDDVLLPLLHKSSVVVFIIVGGLWVLDIWGIDIKPYLAGVGISGLVLGLALQDSLKNVFGGISLIVDKTFHIGDKIKLDSGDVGEVYDIGLRSTKIRTYDNEIIIIPNGQLANSKLQNYTKPDLGVRVGVSVTLEYGVSIEPVKKIMVDTITTLPDISTHKPVSVQFTKMGDFGLDFMIYFWVDDWKQSYAKKLEATERLYAILQKKKIGIANPTQIVYVRRK